MQSDSENNSYIQQQRSLYLKKNEYLFGLYPEISPREFYREIFPEGSFERKGVYDDHKGNGIGLVIEKGGKIRRYMITDELDNLAELCSAEFSLISPISYFGRNRSAENARYLYALAFDLDGVGMPQLRDTLHQMNRGVLPKATFVVNSGTGLHLYYVFDNPIPMYPQIQKFLKELKFSLTRQIWNRFTSTIVDPQVQGVMQGFRVVGSNSKLGSDYPVVAYRYGGHIDVESLVKFIPDSMGEQQRVVNLLRQSSTMTLEEAKKKYPDWYERRIVNGERRGRWVVKRDLYDWWLHRITDEIKVGHRFYGIMTLAIYAKKCNISEDELRADADKLMRIFDDMSVEESNRFTEDDVQCALNMYNENFVTFPRDDIGKLCAMSMPVNRRNYRNQSLHLQMARAIQKISDEAKGTNWRVGNGRPTSEYIVYEWRKKHPDGKKIDCERNTGLSRHTILKWWDRMPSQQVENEHILDKDCLGRLNGRK